MAYNISYEEKHNYISIKVEGGFGLSVLKQLSADVSKFIEKYGCNRILNDLRLAKLNSDTLNIYTMPKTARDSGIENRCKRALVVSEQSSDFHFLETVFLNQGHNVKMFTHIEEAMSWLLD